MRPIVSILVVVLAAVTWVPCAATDTASPMACCAKAQHECPNMEPTKACCSVRQQPTPEPATARSEPLASVFVQSNQVLLAFAVIQPVILAPVRTGEARAEITPPTRHSIDCILLI